MLDQLILFPNGNRSNNNYCILFTIIGWNQWPLFCIGPYSYNILKFCYISLTNILVSGSKVKCFLLTSTKCRIPSLSVPQASCGHNPKRLFIHHSTLHLYMRHMVTVLDYNYETIMRLSLLPSFIYVYPVKLTFVTTNILIQIT